MKDSLHNREELTFLIFKENYKNLLKEISEFVQPVYYSDNPWVETIYFNTSDLQLPWTYALKARRYIKNASNKLKIDLKAKNLVAQIRLNVFVAGAKLAIS
jgi:hypothetical protein